MTTNLKIFTSLCVTNKFVKIALECSPYKYDTQLYVFTETGLLQNIALALFFSLD